MRFRPAMRKGRAMQTTLNELAQKWDLVSPVPPGAAASTRPVAARQPSLTGARVAFLDNSKDNAALLLRTYAEILDRDFSLGGTSFISKPLHTRVADEAQIQAAARGDCAVVAIGD
jgi:hypothetical protein